MIVVALNRAAKFVDLWPADGILSPPLRLECGTDALRHPAETNRDRLFRDQLRGWSPAILGIQAVAALHLRFVLIN